MSHPSPSLSYSARREVLAHIAPRYQQATDAQKTLLLDQIVEPTGYERTYAIRLLNHETLPVSSCLLCFLPVSVLYVSCSSPHILGMSRLRSQTNGSIQLHPDAFHFHVGLIHPPGIDGRLEIRATTFLQFGA